MAADDARIDAARGHAPGPGHASRWFTIVATLAFAAVLVVAVVAAAGHNGTPPNDDEALIDLQVFDVGSH
ncbi:MAG: hypothetical protein JJE46_00005, partial [Acidimicrobiia bacterium]|nr:hypothetical protein [Acidimicrobiia bacterium]